MMPSFKLVEMLQIAKDAGNTLFLHERITSKQFCVVGDLESEEEFSTKSMDHDSSTAAEETTQTTPYLSGFDIETMKNARKKTTYFLTNKEITPKLFLRA